MALPVLLTLSVALNFALLTLSAAGAAYTYHLYSENRSLRTDNGAFAVTLTSLRDDYRALVAAFQSFREDHRVDLRAIAAALQGRAPAAGPAARPDILAIQREVMDELAESAALADRNMDRAAERQRARSRSPTPAAGRPQRPGVRLSRSIARRASTVDMSSCRIALGGRRATLAAM
jgi:hypothetical protein